jgi:MFS family permease
MSIAIVALGAMYGPSGAFFSELFDTNVRYSGASLGYQLASAVAGGFAPLIATALLAGYGYPVVALYIIVMALIPIVASTSPPRPTRGISPGEGATRNTRLPGDQAVSGQAA